MASSRSSDNDKSFCVGARGRRLEKKESESKEDHVSMSGTEDLETLDCTTHLAVLRPMLYRPPPGLLTANIILPQTHREITTCNNQSIFSLINKWRIPKLFKYDPSMLTIVRHPRGFASTPTGLPIETRRNSLPWSSLHEPISPNSSESNELFSAKRDLDSNEFMLREELEKTKHEVTMKSRQCHELIQEKSDLYKEIKSLQARVQSLQQANATALSSDNMFNCQEDYQKVIKDVQQLSSILDNVTNMNPEFVERHKKFEAFEKNQKESEKNLEELKSRLQKAEKCTDVEKRISEKKDKVIENLRKQISEKKSTISEMQGTINFMKIEKTKLATQMEKKMDDVVQMYQCEKEKSEKNEKSITDLTNKLDKFRLQSIIDKENSAHEGEVLVNLKKELQTVTTQLDVEKSASESVKKSLDISTRRLDMIANELVDEKRNSERLNKVILDLQIQLTTNQKAIAEMQNENGKSRSELLRTIEEASNQWANEKLLYERKDCAIRNMEQQLITQTQIITDLRIALINSQKENEDSLNRLRVTMEELETLKKQHDDSVVSLVTQHRMEMRTNLATIAMLSQQLEKGKQQIRKMNAVLQTSFSGSTPPNQQTVTCSVVNIEKEVTEFLQMSQASSSYAASGEKVNECLQEIMSVIGAPPETTSSASK